MSVRVGTSGFSFPEWRGEFYPDGLPTKKWLAFYAARLHAVEINNTFYRLPTEKTLSTWTSQVPAGFTFALKASRFLTHMLKLQGASEAVTRFWGLAAMLGEKRGPVLVQLPPFVTKDLGVLRDFLSLLPKGHMAALEFRHPSWLEDDVFDALRDKGAALVASETDEEEARLVPTADFAYLRLRRSRYDDAAIAAWAKRLAKHEARDTYVFFKHEEGGLGARLATQLAALVSPLTPR